jgi:hypothetical protein
MKDGFDAVAVGIADERAVVAAVVLGPRSGRAVVRVPRLGDRVPPRLHRLPRARGEGDVQPSRDGPAGTGLRDREVPPLVEVLAGARELEAELAERELVEGS